jgi:hypothetical protein
MIDPVEITGAIGALGDTFFRAFGVIVVLGTAVVFSGVMVSARGHARMWIPAAARPVAEPGAAPAESADDPSQGDQTSADLSPLRAAIEKVQQTSDEAGPGNDPSDALAAMIEAARLSAPTGPWLAQIRLAGGEWITIGAGGTRAAAARHAAKAYAKAPTRGAAASIQVRAVRRPDDD